jgi:hypothetical protein
MKTEFTPQQRAEIYEEAKGLLNENNGLCEVLDNILEAKIRKEEHLEYYWLDYDAYIPLYFPEIEIVKPETTPDLTSVYWWPMGAEIRREKLDEMIELTKIK